MTAYPAIPSLGVAALDCRPLRPLDDLAAAMERRWGVDRLPRLVAPELAARFRAAQDMHGLEWPDASPDRRAALDAMMGRAWQALDAAATAAGHEPLPPACWEVALPEVPGAVTAIALDNEHAQALLLRARAEGRQGYAVWTLEEVARVIQASSVVSAVKRQWPAAVVRPRRSMPQDGEGLGDILPLAAETAP